MKYSSDEDEVYKYSVNDVMYCFRYQNPTTRNEGRTFSGVAIAWKDGDKDHTFTVPFFVKSEEIDQCHARICQGIEEHVNK